MLLIVIDPVNSFTYLPVESMVCTPVNKPYSVVALKLVFNSLLWLLDNNSVISPV